MGVVRLSASEAVVGVMIADVVVAGRFTARTPNVVTHLDLMPRQALPMSERIDQCAPDSSLLWLAPGCLAAS